MTPINLNPNERQVSQINRKPLAYTVGVMVVLLGVMTGLYINSNSNRNSYCREENALKDAKIKALELKVDKMNEKRDAEYIELKKNTDSVLRAAINSITLPIKNKKQS